MALYEKHDKVQLVNMSPVDRVQAFCRDAASAELTRVAKESTRVGQAVRFNTASVERTRVVKARIAASGGCFFDYFIKSKKKTMPLKNHALGLNMKKILKTQGKGAVAKTAKSAANRAKNVVEDTESETDFHTAVVEWLEEDIAAIMTELALAEKASLKA